MRVRNRLRPIKTLNSTAIPYGGIEGGSPQLDLVACLEWLPSWAVLTPPTGKLLGDRYVGSTMTDVETPGYRKILENGGLLPLNPMSQTVTEDGSYSYASLVVSTAPVRLSNGKYTKQVRLINYAVRPTPSLFTVSPSWGAMETAARAKLQEGFMDVLTSLAEFNKTIELIVGFKKRVRDAVLDLTKVWHNTRKGKKHKTFNQAMTSLSSFWLEYRFGWRILYYDYESVVKSIEAIRTMSLRKAYRVAQTIELPDVSTTSYSATNASVPRIRAVSTIKRTAVARTGIVGSVNINGPLQVDPLTTAWELLPLSLVLDMFWNVGDAIKNWSPFSRVKEEGRWRSLRRESVVSVEMTPLPTAGYPLVLFWQQVNVGLYSTVTHFERTKQEPSTVDFGVNINLSPTKAVDLGSIAVVLSRSLMGKLQRTTTL